jgi:hypothetical protein
MAGPTLNLKHLIRQCQVLILVGNIGPVVRLDQRAVTVKG